MKNIIIFISIMALTGIWYIHKKYHSANASLAEITAYQTHNSPAKPQPVRNLAPNRGIASVPKDPQIRPATIPTQTAARPQNQSKNYPARTQAVSSPTAQQRKIATVGPSGAAALQKSADLQDMDLLKQIAVKARQQGSQVAYIGEIPELYAYDPHFFSQQIDADGQKWLHAQRVDATAKINTPDGPADLQVQRLPYAIPSGNGINYDVLNQVILRATDDGAMLINLTASGVDRSRLQSSIDYARSRGVAVVTVPPPGKR
jgi:hypothetical protein